MSDLPVGWSTKRISDVAEVVRGVTYSKSDVMPGDSARAIPLLRATNIQPGKLDYDDPVWVPQGLVKPVQELKVGDLVVASSSGSLSVVGKNARVLDERKATFGAFCTVIRPVSIEGRFLALWLESPTVRQLWSDKARGSNINNLKSSDLSGTEIPVPPLHVQKRIVETLEDHLSRLDKALAEVGSQLRNLHPLRLALLRKAFDPNQRDGESQVDESRMPLGELVSVRYGKDVPKPDRTPSGTFPVVGSAGVMTYTDLSLTRLPAVLVGRKGNVGSVQLFMDGCHPVDTAYLLEVPEIFNPKYLFYQLESKDLKSLDSSTAIPSLRRQDLESVELIAPPIETQRSRIRALEAELSRIEEAESLLQEAKKCSETLRRSLLHAAFTGQLTSEEPND